MITLAVCRNVSHEATKVEEHEGFGRGRFILHNSQFIISTEVL